MTAAEIFQKHMRPLGPMSIGVATLDVTIAAMEEYGKQEYKTKQEEREQRKFFCSTKCKNQYDKK